MSFADPMHRAGLPSATFPIVSRDNCFDLLRTMAALTVLFSHSFALSGLPQPMAGQETTLGSLAVWVFFAISGYLIAQSSLASSTVQSFATKRLLRIMPALLILLVLSVFVAGPLLTQLSVGDYFANSHSWAYLVRNPAFGNQGELPGVFNNLPLAGEFNGSLWTIKYELLMYALLGAGMAMVQRSQLLPFCAGLAAVFFILTLAHHCGLVDLNIVFWRLEGLSDLRMDRVSLLGCLFFSGAVLAFRYPNRHAAHLVIGSVIFIFIFRNTALFRPFTALLLPLIVIYIARGGGEILRHLKPRHDLSYGIYLYAFPVQQTIASFGFTGWQQWPFSLGASAVATVALAYLSWIFVERPALNLKRRFA